MPKHHPDANAERVRTHLFFKSKLERSSTKRKRRPHSMFNNLADFKLHLFRRHQRLEYYLLYSYMKDQIKLLVL